MPRILVVDDDRVSRRVIESQISQMASEVLCCEDGETAWKLINTEPYPDILILDWFLPGFTGLELCKMQQRSELPFMYKMIVSGIANREQIVEALHSGAHDVILKPVDLSLLETRVRVGWRIVEERRAGEEATANIKLYAEHMDSLARERAKQLVHAERMSSLGVMSAGIAHEVNNPMSFISGNVQTLRRFWSDIEPVLRDARSADPEKAQKLEFVAAEMPQLLEGIMKGVERVTRIVQGLKKYSGRDDGVSTDFDVNESIRQALELVRFSLGKQVRVALDLHNEPVFVNGSALELEQVLINLFVNANQAMEQVQTPFLGVESRVRGETLEICIEDSGPGIPEELMEKIWTPFFTTKPPGKGTGLGLSISAGIIRRHGGTFAVENRDEGGARFYLRLPRVTETRSGSLCTCS